MRTRLIFRIRCQRNRDGLLARGLIVFLTPEKLSPINGNCSSMVESRIVIPVVVGSNPISYPKLYNFGNIVVNLV